MSQRTQRILSMAKQKGNNLLFLPKYETTKGLEKCYQQQLLNILNSESCSREAYESIHKEDICVQRLANQKYIKKDTSESDVIEKENDFKCESTKYLERQTRSKEIPMNVYKFENQEEEIREYRSEKEKEPERDIHQLDTAQEENISLKTINDTQRENIGLLEKNKSNEKYIVTEEQTVSGNDGNSCDKNKTVDASKVIILQNFQLKPPRYQSSDEESSDSQMRKISLRKKRNQPGPYIDTFENDEMEEEHFQSSGSEYLPSSDDDENKLLPFLHEGMINKNEGARTKKRIENHNIVRCTGVEQNGIMPIEELKTDLNNSKYNEVSVDIKKDTPNRETSHSTNTGKNIDRLIVNFGKSILPSPPSVESHLSRSQDKKTTCPYCLKDITHFSRHLTRNHDDEGAVKEFSSYPPNHPKRKILLDAIRRQGNFVSSLSTNKIRPVRRPKATGENLDTSYVSCPDCMGFFRRQYLRRHRKQCSLRSGRNTMMRESHLSLAQVFTVCSGVHGDFLSSLRLKKDVFPIMRNDNISKTAMNDMLICSYAESLLRKHKRIQIRNVISNKMRELGRLLIILKNVTGIQSLSDVLKPQFFDNIIGAVRVISGYCEESKTFKASSLALHMGTTLKQVCDVATKNIIKKSPIISCTNTEESLKDIKRLRNLIENHWNSEISSLALKNLKENNYDSPKLLPLTEDVMKFQSFVMNVANEASSALKDNINISLNYRKLVECVFALTLLINRKRIGEIQYLTTETYNSRVNENQQTEFLHCLSKTEQALCKNFKRVVTGGKGSRPVAILFPPDLQEFIQLLMNFRNVCMPKTNPYLFGNPNTDGWLSGYHIVKKMAEKSGVSDTTVFTSTRLRKQIATVLQAINIKEDEMEQFATFMGHTKNTHQSYYRLPQDLYQTAKVSKLLIAINSGKAGKYKGKSLDDITLSDNESLLGDNEAGAGELLYGQNDDCENEVEEKMELDIEEQQEVKNVLLDESEIKMKKRGSVRGKWSSEQRKGLKAAFQDHIKNKRAPRKEEAEMFMRKHGDLYKDKSWVAVKAFIYNTYKNNT